MTAWQSAGRPPQTDSSRADDRAGAQLDAGRSVTVVGCLLKEEDVPGRRPTPLERAGLGEDYILTHAQVQGASNRARGAAREGQEETTGSSGRGASDVAGTSGATPRPALPMSSMYQIEGLDDDRLRRFVGRRVEVTGRGVRFEDEAGPASAETAGNANVRDDDRNREVPRFEAASIRALPGACSSR